MRAGATGWIVIGIAALVIPSAGLGQECIGDCDGDGVVSVTELVTGVRAVLGGAAPADCAAWDPDGDGEVRIEDLVRGVARALDGTCAGAATPTGTPTVVDALVDLILPPFAEACHMSEPFQSLRYGAGPDGLGFYCDAGAGHDNHTVLHRYASADDARAAFVDATVGFVPAILRDLPAAYREQPFMNLGGAYRTLVWQLDCWVATVGSFDDTKSRYAPDPTELSEGILDAAREELVAACSSAPTPTPRVSPTPTQAPDACRHDGDCQPPSETCLEPGGFIGCGICYSDADIDAEFQRCSVDADCDGGGICQPLGRSTRTCSPCSGDANVCMPGCAGDEECGPGKICDRGRCVPQGCSADEDCPPQHACAAEDETSMACERITCTSDLECGAGFCVEGSCYGALGVCTAFPP